MGASVVKVIVEFLYVFAVVSFRIGQAEEPLLENRVLSIPESEREAKSTGAVAEAEKPVFAPAISSGAGLVM